MYIAVSELTPLPWTLLSVPSKVNKIFHQGEREGKDVRLGLVFSIGTGNPPSVELDNVGVCGASTEQPFA